MNKERMVGVEKLAWGMSLKNKKIPADGYRVVIYPHMTQMLIFIDTVLKLSKVGNTHVFIR